MILKLLHAVRGEIQVTIGAGGIYDPETTELLRALNAKGVLLIVAEGKRGSGFSVAMDPLLLEALPGMLEHVAEQIRADVARLKELPTRRV